MAYDRVLRRGLAVSSLLALMAVPALARAYEDRAALTVEAGYGVILSDAPLPQHAFVSGLNVGFGLSDTWELRVDAAYGYHPDGFHRGRTSVEIVYVVDVLAVVPYVGIGTGVVLSGLVRSRGSEVWADWEAHAVVGFDYMLTPDLVAGLVVRPIFLLTNLPVDPFHLTVTLRFGVLVDL